MPTRSTIDRVTVIECFLSMIPEELAKGRIVELGKFGNFWLRSTSERSEMAGKVSGKQITSLIPRCNAGKQFKGALRSAKFEERTKRGRRNIKKSL